VNFNSILIGTDNADRLTEYYTKVLGTPRFSEQGYTTWVLGNGVVTVGAHSEVHGSNEQPGRFIWNIESDDIHTDFARMRDAGAIVIREPYEFEGIPGSWIATLADPDNNYFQLTTPFDPLQMSGDAS
jgi:predicted enzyme related to lactoylglutathione lyase